jgi:hypothetical protein
MRRYTTEKILREQGRGPRLLSPSPTSKGKLICRYLSIHIVALALGKMNIVLEDAVEERFRKTVFQSKGMKKGNISEAIREAIEAWMDRETKMGRRTK